MKLKKSTLQMAIELVHEHRTVEEIAINRRSLQSTFWQGENSEVSTGIASENQEISSP